MNRERRSSAHNEPRDRQALFEQPFAQRKRALKTGAGHLPPRGPIGIMDMSVVSVQAVDGQVGQVVDQGVQLGRRVARLNSCPAHADFQIDQHRHRAVKTLRPPRGRAGRVRVVNRRPKCRLAVSADQMDEPLEIGAGKRICQEHVGAPGRRRHLGFGDRGTLVFVYAERLGQPDDFGHLVGLDVWPKPPWRSREGDHFLDVPANQARVNHKGRAKQFRHVVNPMISIRHGETGLSDVGKGRCRPQSGRRYDRARVQQAMSMLFVNLELIE